MNSASDIWRDCKSTNSDRMCPLVIRTLGRLFFCLAWVNHLLRLNFNLLPSSERGCAQGRLLQDSGSQGMWVLDGNSNSAGARRPVSGWVNLLFSLVHSWLRLNPIRSGMVLCSFSSVPLTHFAQISNCAAVLSWRGKGNRSCCV